VPRRPRLLATAGVLAAGALALAGCSGGGDKAATATTTTTATGPSIRKLYANHPEIRSFVFEDVVYTPATRDKVLAVCRKGGPAANARDREDSRVFGCAPLIFFFFNFGKQKNVPESVDVARKLFWYAAEIKGPYDALQPLADLLQRWGVR
jgi:hypothetical protein